MISGSKSTATAAIGIHPTKARLSKLQSGRDDTLEERYAKKMSVLNLEKMMPQKRMECFRLLFDHLACIKDQF